MLGNTGLDLRGNITFNNEKTITDIDEGWVMKIDDQPRNLTKKITVEWFKGMNKAVDFFCFYSIFSNKSFTFLFITSSKLSKKWLFQLL